MRKNSNIIRAFDALTIVKGINSLGGPDKQVYYIESDVYAPDRRITPLLLQPYVNVSDPNGIITAGDKVSELVDGAWYVDAIDPQNRVTKSSAGSTLDDPFTIGDNHRLMVRLNTDKSVLLFFEGDYYDSRKGSKIHISLSYMLSTTHNSQNKPAPKVLLSKGASYTYNPLDDLTELIIESQLADDGKLLRGAVEWCEVEGTKITAISDAMPYYISGQHSDKLKINPSLMGDVVIRARNVSEEFYNKVYGINKVTDGIDFKDLNFRNYLNGGGIELNKDNDETTYLYRTYVGTPLISGKEYVATLDITGLADEEKGITSNIWLAKYQYSGINKSFSAENGRHIYQFVFTASIETETVFGIDLYNGFYGFTSAQRASNRFILHTIKVTEGKEATTTYIPSPKDYAPDGIIKGKYQSDMKFTPLYPNIEANVVYLTTPVIKKGVERIKAQAMLSTNKKIITNPEKHFDLKWILKPTTAGGSETVVGTGEFLDIPVTNLPEGRVIGLDLDYNFKKQ